jgi:hypothetical protein
MGLTIWPRDVLARQSHPVADPIRALYWSAAISRIMVAPIIVVVVALATNRYVVAQFTLGPGYGWSVGS